MTPLQKTIRVLLVEDDQVDYQAVKRALKSKPHLELDHVESLSDGLERIRQDPYDCILLDWYLPDGEGEAFFTMVADIVPWTPIIIMTSSEGSVMTASALAKGAQDYIVKGTFDGEQLMRAIDYAIARKHAERLRWSKVQDDRIRFINQIVAGVAHEVNNPIAWISSNIDILHDQIRQDDLDQPEAMELLDECKQGVQRIAAVVKVLRSYAESSNKNVELCDVGAVVQYALKEVEQLHPWELHCACYSAPSLPKLLADKSSLRQAFYQILLNAFQAVSSQPRESLLGQSVHVEVSLSVQEHDMVIDFHDAGPGLDPGIGARVFEPFYSARREANLGMGLAIAHDVIYRHRGSLLICEPSELGGAHLQVRLPIS